MENTEIYIEWYDSVRGVWAELEGADSIEQARLAIARKMEQDSIMGVECSRYRIITETEVK